MIFDFITQNFESIVNFIGGLGLFLLGIVIMSDGLRALAGDAMRSALIRFTNSPLSGAITGIITTAVLRSSTVTTVAAVGFVAAGLMSFPASLGIIFGANTGTTITGWIVALFGFKFQINNLMMIFLFIGVLLKLLAKNRIATFGYTLGGFSIVFLGVAMMQQGMSGFGEFISPQQLPDDTIIGRLKLVAFGILFTTITQSSSAGVATALTALYAGSINFEQAAALVIGMDVGTTITAVLATIGQSVEARRTGFSHVIYNIITAFIALLFITPYTLFCDAFFPNAITHNAEISLVAFHTIFNIFGLIIILPFTKQFAAMMVKLIKEKHTLYTDTLDTMLLNQPSLALTAVQNSTYREIIALLSHINAILGDPQSRRTNIGELQEALNKTHTYIDQISLQNESSAQWERLLSMIHTLDHLQRLHERCEEEEDRAITLRDTKYFAKERDIMIDGIKVLIEAMESGEWYKVLKSSQATKNRLYKSLKPSRAAVVKQIARGEIDVANGTDYMEGIRWLKRVSWHLVRISYHYERALLAAGKP